MTTTPHDGMTLAQFQAAREALRGALAKFEQATPNCMRCSHFEMGDCKKHGAPVPKEFQQEPERCMDWTYDGIPF